MTFARARLFGRTPETLNTAISARRGDPVQSRSHVAHPHYYDYGPLFRKSVRIASFPDLFQTSVAGAFSVSSQTPNLCRTRVFFVFEECFEKFLQLRPDRFQQTLLRRISILRIKTRR